MITNTLHMEHRWGSRVELFVPAQVATAAGRAFNATVCNASLSGAFIETPVRLPVLSRIALRPQLAGTGWIEACVVRNEARGVGVEWLDPALRPISALLALRNEGPEFGVSPRLQRDSVSWQLLNRLQRSPAGT
ncbi:MAG: PilZ domain-containing protein [Steroidobacteraceae bacterium]